ncbi:MAG: hypothetical protein HYV95_08865 [Opitutae bacterium]|nr:hypothetical protein [Opitutae bacterium]
MKFLLCLFMAVIGLPALADTPLRLSHLAAARIEGGYAKVQYDDGRKAVLPLATMPDEELAWIKEFAAKNPLTKGRSVVVEAKQEETKTIASRKTEGGVETILLNPPGKFRDQIGGTCMLYARAHELEIAGYPIRDVDLYRIINIVPHDHPYTDFRYYIGMLMLFFNQKPSPVLHYPDGTIDQYEWARQELRKGRPVLAALTESVWLTLPADFVATHPFIAGSKKIGHQVVINGFTYNAQTRQGTFHVVNSWRQLAEFDLPVDKTNSKILLIEQSLSPKGQPLDATEKITITKVTQLNAVGKNFLFLAETNRGPKRIVGPSEASIREMIEADNRPKDMDTLFGELVVNIYDYIYDKAEPEVRDLAAAGFLSEINRVPVNVSLPHVDMEVKTSIGKVYFVRVAVEKVLKVEAESTAEALERARPRGSSGQRL